MPLIDDREFPAALAAVAEVEFEYDDGDGVDLYPFDEFVSAEETTDWLRAWTGNQELDGAAFRVFGKDGTGGQVALWLVRGDAALIEQPVVFLGSEGETGVIARCLSDYLWLLADGFGPFEVVEYPTRDPHPQEGLTAIAERHAQGPRRSAHEVIAAAAEEFPHFQKTIDDLCR
ncbi:SMI1/KNR4 family protein [Streptomyces sp. NPDC056500]|uniref:SMI1/KNR4 family protein n=1 Tax=Streptomyces sp. NPDC056500 TaxID=3345840 RepID=UPI0036A88531